MTMDERKRSLTEIIAKHREMLTKEENNSLKWSETLYFCCLFNLFIQPLFMISRYRKLKGDMKKAMIPALVLVPLFNLGLTDYCGRRM